MSKSGKETSGARVCPRIYCCCNGCLNSSIKRPELSFFKLPRDEKRRHEWLRLISREDLIDKKAKSYVVCEEHFNAHEILRAEHRKNLKKNVVPSLNLPDMHRKRVVAFDLTMRRDVITQTDEISLDVHKKGPLTGYLHKRKLKPKAKPAKRIKLDQIDGQTDILQLETFHKLCDKFLTDEFAELVKAQTLSEQRKKKKSLSIKTDINEKVMMILKTKVGSMTDIERNCALVIDMMELKANLAYNTKKDRIIGFHEVDGAQTPEPATAALVLMLRGIVVNWKQPVGFALLSEYRNYEEITKWIDKLVIGLFDMGLNIWAFVSEMSPDLLHLANERLVRQNVPFFFIEKKKLFYVFDAPDLIKKARDMFLENEFHFQGHVATFDAIREFYKLDQKKKCRLASKLTEKHLSPDNIEKNELWLAVELLSNSVAAGLSTYIDFYVIDSSAEATVKVIKLLNDLFDLLNSVHLKHDNSFKKVFKGDLPQLQLLEEANTFFKNLKVVEPHSGCELTMSAKFINGFQVSINAIHLMLEELRKKGITFIKTRRLSKDVTEKFFAQVRSINKINSAPSSTQFVSAFQELFITDILMSAKGKDCSVELAKLFTDSKKSEDCNEMELLKTESQDFKDELENNVQVKSSEYNQLEIPDKNSTVYLSSYLLKRCVEKHKDCEILRTYVAPAPEQRIQSFSADVSYQKYREFSEQTRSSLLVVPYDDLIEYVEKMEQEFRNTFKGKHVNRSIAASIYRAVSALTFALPCPCFPIVYLKKLFIRMRIFHTVQFNNKKWHNSGTKRKYFTVPHLSC